MALTEQQKNQYLAEIFDEKRVNLWCSKHNYLGPVKGRPEVKPASRCADCWKIWFIHELATTPADQRAKKLDEIEEVLRDMVQMVEAGTWDFEPYEHAKIEIGAE